MSVKKIITGILVICALVFATCCVVVTVQVCQLLSSMIHQISDLSSQPCTGDAVTPVHTAKHAPGKTAHKVLQHGD